jgi:hypothetical protein
MQSASKLRFAQQVAVIAAAFSAAVAVSGCGMPAAPQPPSLKLPNPVKDLAAIRTGDQVWLTWTMPRRDTEKVLLKGQITARVCRRLSDAAPCLTAGTLELAPLANGALTETLPPELAAGAPRALSYFVELDNRKGRSAGLSNAALIVAGEAPGAVTGLSAEVRKDGMVLRWNPDASDAAIRLNRKLVTAAKSSAVTAQNEPQQNGPAKNRPAQGLLAPETTPPVQNLLVDSDPASGHAPSGVAIDKGIQFGETYEYRAQRVQRFTVDGKTLELDGSFSAPVRVEAADIFPPETPTGLAAVASVVASVVGNGPETAGTETASPATAIDLSWQPNTEADLAGYAVYRHEAAAGEGGGSAADWKRVSGAQPLAGPGYHDASVQAGHRYEYAVTAIDRGGHESERSAPAQETVPGP